MSVFFSFCRIFMKKSLLFVIFQDEDDIGCFGRSDTSGPQHYSRSKVSGKPQHSQVNKSMAKN